MHSRVAVEAIDAYYGIDQPPATTDASGDAR